MLCVIVLYHALSVWWLLRPLWQRNPTSTYGRRKSDTPHPCPARFARKPDWVPREIVQMKALMPDSGCRALADCFNRRFAGRASVGKTYVHGVLVRHRHEIAILRKQLRRRKPKAVPHNLTWGMDLTGKRDCRGETHAILGIVEHASRANLVLLGVRDKASITLLRHVLDAIERYGKPHSVRTDNEAVFTSRLFRWGLWLLGIRHQRTDPGCPWMNGRVERFFGTLKQKLDLWDVDSLDQLNGALNRFRVWYNHVRPHQNLAGWTPAEAWQGVGVFTAHAPPSAETFVEEWDGLLTGYYLRL